MERVAFLGDNKQINIWHSENRTLKQLTYPLLEGEKVPSLWPTWSRDGRWMAYFSPCNQMYLHGCALPKSMGWIWRYWRNSEIGSQFICIGVRRGRI